MLNGMEEAGPGGMVVGCCGREREGHLGEGGEIVPCLKQSCNRGDQIFLSVPIYGGELFKSKKNECSTYVVAQMKE